MKTILLPAILLLAGCAISTSPPPPVLDFCATYVPDYSLEPSEADIKNNAVYFEMCEEGVTW